MEKQSFFRNYLSDLGQFIADIDHKTLQNASHAIIEGRQRGGKTIIVGNGGSAAIASHVAVDLTKAAKTRAINFNESDLITCFANDYGYENWVAEALSAYADTNDVAILISSSGKSPNIVNGARMAKQLGLVTITLSGFSADNPLRTIGDINLWVHSESYNVVEMAHQGWLLAIVDYIVDTSGAQNR